MGKLNNLGSFSGKVGEIVGVRTGDHNYIRKRPVRTAPPTEGELKQNTIFGMVQKWINPISPFLRLGYKEAHPTLHALNAAKSAIHKAAVQREPVPGVLPELVKVSTGDLALPESIDAFLVDTTDIVFVWDTIAPIKSSPRDRIMMLAYNPESTSAFMNTAGPQRDDGNATLSLDAFAAGSYHLYAAFISEDGNRRSESVYLGVVSL